MDRPSSTSRLKSLLAAVLIGTALLAGGTFTSACADETAGKKIETITAEELQKRLTSTEVKPLLVDVREPNEFDAVHIEGALLAPLGSVAKDMASVDKNREIVLVCRSGRRSGLAYEILAERGFTSLKNMQGGMIAWEKLGYPVVKKQ